MDLLTGINKREVLKYLGYRGGEVEKGILDAIDKMEKLVFASAQPRACHAVFAVKSRAPLLFNNCEVRFDGNDADRLLENSDECIFMAATLGIGIDARLRSLSVTNMSDAVIFDACASSAIENVCDNYMRALEEEYGKKGLYLTDRFSPGYGDMPIENQKYITETLNTQKRIGLCLNSSMTLQPVKSVTALIGISHNKEKRRGECESCSIKEGCAFRLRGEVCYE